MIEIELLAYFVSFKIVRRETRVNESFDHCLRIVFKYIQQLKCGYVVGLIVGRQIVFDRHPSDKHFFVALQVFIAFQSVLFMFVNQFIFIETSSDQ